MTTIVRIALAAGALAAVSACVEEESDPPVYGNVLFDCGAGMSCSCSVTGNCVVGCPGGGCHLECTGTSNCFFTCGAPGGCTIACANTGNCQADCPGGGCDLTCSGMNNGIVTGPGCSAVRTAGTGTCTATP